MEQIEDLTLIKFLGKGGFGEVYLSKRKGKNQYFATKKVEREITDRPSFKKYFENEINLLKNCNHPNIVKLEGIKKSKKHYYIIMEYINGGSLADCLKKYMERYKIAFPEEIVQYLMRQILEGLVYLHKLKIIHRDLKLDNIMVNFDSMQDKQNLDMMKAKIKIIDFDFATKLSPEKNDLAFTAIGTLKNADPIIINKFTKRKDINLGYDQKVDIWSIGTVCYELLIGKAAFDAQTLEELVDKVENGYFLVPKSVSKEVVSFINSMLQFDTKSRLSAEELRQHPFLTKNISQFTKMDTVRASKKKESLKNSSTIWSIFLNGEKYQNIKGDMTEILEEETNVNSTTKKEKQVNNSISRTYTDNQLGLGFYMDNNGYTDNQLGFNKPITNPNINFVNNNYNNNPVNLHRARTTQDFPTNNFNTSYFYRQNMNPTLQKYQSGPTMSPMMNFQPQKEKIIQTPTYEIPQNYEGSFHQNTMPQGNFQKSRTFKEDSNQLLKEFK